MFHVIIRIDYRLKFSEVIIWYTENFKNTEWYILKYTGQQIFIWDKIS